ncbi:MAG: DNA methyltransferase [Clostridia bacterium]|nr:DNA methyltransferase [Clostridia bacterium]
MANIHLSQAKNAKNDEFYTQWGDIEREVQAYLEYNPDVFRGKTILCPCDDPEWSNFTKFFALHFNEYGLKKLISTSFAPESKTYKEGYQISLFEKNDPKFDDKKTRINGKLFVLTSEDLNHDGEINIEDLKWDYLTGDGDFKSDEVKKLRAEADIIVTNPPFSLFREFLAWILEAQKQFLIIGNMNAITYKEVFPLIEENKVWLGNGFQSGNAFFSTPFAGTYCEGVYNVQTGLVKFRNCCWFTNIDHGRRHQPLPLMTMEENLRFSKHKEIKGKTAYDRYDNYDAIEVPFTDAIPSDFDGIMGVPISFLEKYCPEQYEIIGLSRYTKTQGMSKEFVDAYYKSGQTGTISEGHPDLCYYDHSNNKPVVPYMRVLIKHKGA